MSDSVNKQNTNKQNLKKKIHLLRLSTLKRSPPGRSPAFPPARGALPLSSPGPPSVPERRRVDGPFAPEESGEETPQPGSATTAAGDKRRSPRPASAVPDVPRGRGGAETARPEPTPPPARSRPAGGLHARSPASEAQGATPAPARRRSPCFRPRSASPVSYLPRAPTPPPRPGSEVLVLSSVEALGLLRPTRVGCSCPRRPGRRPRPVPDKPCSYWLLFPPLTLGPAPGTTRGPS